MDEYGFPLGDLPQRQRQRLRVRAWTTHNQWTARYATPAAAAAAPRGELQALAASHGVLARYRADVWWRAVGSGCFAAYAAAPPYGELLAASAARAPLDVVRQIELDLPRTFPEQADFAAALAGGATVFDGSRSSIAEALEAGVPLGAVGAGSVHDGVRRILRGFVALHPEIGYLQVRAAPGPRCARSHRGGGGRGPHGAVLLTPQPSPARPPPPSLPPSRAVHELLGRHAAARVWARARGARVLAVCAARQPAAGGLVHG